MFRSSIRTALIAPSIFVVVVTGLVVGGFSYVNGGRSVDAVAKELRTEILNRVLDHLDDFFGAPHTILRENARLIRSGLLDPGLPEQLQRHFLKQNIDNRVFNSIYFGTPQGGLAGGGIEASDGSTYVTETENFAPGSFYKFAVGPDDGQRKLLLEVPNFDARARPWFRSATNAQDGAWSDIYVLFTGHDMAITPSRAVRTPEGKLIGIVAGDIFLSGLNQFLHELHSGRPGISFITDMDGFLVAASTDQQLVASAKDGGAQSRMPATRSTIPEIALATATLYDKFGTLTSIARHRSASFELNGKRNFVEIAPFKDRYGLHLLAATVIPESTYTKSLVEGNTRTLALIIVAILAMGGVAAWMAHRIAKPIAQLNESIDKMAQGDMSVRLQTDRADEIGALARSFNDLAQKLSLSFDELHEREKSLYNQEQFLNSIIDNIPNMLFVKDAKTLRFIRVNKSAERLFGRKEKDILGKSDRDFFPAEQADFFNANDRQVLESRRPKDIRAEPVNMPGQGERFLHTRKVGVYDKQGQPLYLIGISEDVTDMLANEQALRKAKEDAEHANQAKSNFLATMSHDLRTPLNAIIGFSDMVRQQIFGPINNPHYEEYIEDIHSSGELLVSLINDILDLSKVEAGKYEFVDEDIDVGALADHCARQFGPFASDAKVSLRVEMPTDLPRLKADRRALTQILNNLLSNAIKFTQEGGQVRVLGEVSADGALVVSIKDNGAGMTQEGILRALKPFEYADGATARGRKGTGLGLYICQRFMNLFGGRLEVASTLGIGTTVSLCFPPARVAKDVRQD